MSHTRIHHDGMTGFLLRLAMRRRRMAQVSYVDDLDSVRRAVEPYSILRDKLYAVAGDTEGVLAIPLAAITRLRILPCVFAPRYEIEV